MENKKSKGLRILGISMIVIAAILTGVFLGAWAVSYDNHLSCSADVNTSNSTFTSSDLAFYGFGYKLADDTDRSFTSLTTWSTRDWANMLNFKIDSSVSSIQRSMVNGEISSCILNFKLYLKCRNQQLSFGDWNSSNYDYVCVSSFRVQLNFVWQTNYVNFGKVSSYTLYNQSGAIVSTSYSNSDGFLYSFSTLRSNATSQLSNSTSYLFLNFASCAQIDNDYLLNDFTSDRINTCFFNSCTIGNYSAFSPFDGHLNGFYNYISFNDSTFGFKFSYAIPVEYNSSLNTITNRPMLYYSYRNYYYNQYQVGTENDYYKQGFEDGKQEGVQEGLNTGYTEGVADGRTAGYNEGFNAGVLDSNNYSFLGLMGAVVDAPIQAFTGLFNFEILGVNMKDFLAGLFTICLVILVVRFVLVK